MPSRFLALALFVSLLTGCTVSANAGSAPLSPSLSAPQQSGVPADPVAAARLRLQSDYGQQELPTIVGAVTIMNSVLVVTMVRPPTTRANVDEYWRVCRTLAAAITVPGIPAGQTALVVIQPNGANVVYALAGETACKVA